MSEKNDETAVAKKRSRLRTDSGQNDWLITQR